MLTQHETELGHQLLKTQKWILLQTLMWLLMDRQIQCMCIWMIWLVCSKSWLYTTLLLAILYDRASRQHPAPLQWLPTAKVYQMTSWIIESGQQVSDYENLLNGGWTNSTSVIWLLFWQQLGESWLRPRLSPRPAWNHTLFTHHIHLQLANQLT